MENAYCPDRLALENFGGGCGGGGVGPGPGPDPEPPPPQAAAKDPTTTKTKKASRFIFAVIEASLAARFVSAQLVAMPSKWSSLEETR